jgi:hypothetical protein
VGEHVKILDTVDGIWYGVCIQVFKDAEIVDGHSVAADFVRVQVCGIAD